MDPEMEEFVNTFIFDPSKVNWLNVLPPLADKKVLCYGPVDRNTMDALIHSRCICDVITPEPCKHLNLPSAKIRYINEDGEVPEGMYDLCIVIAREFMKKGRRRIRTIRVLFRALNRDGVLMVGANKSLLERFSIWMIARVLYKEGVKSVVRYSCHPSFDNPLVIYPVVIRHKVRKKIYENAHGKIYISGSLVCFIKEFLVYVVAVAFSRFSPFGGMLYIGSKSGDKTIFDGEERELIISSFIDSCSSQGMLKIWLATPSSFRHIGLPYRAGGNDLVCVLKKTNFPFHNGSKIKNEYNNLMVLERHKSFFTKYHVAFPRPVLTHTSKNRVITVETPIHGVPLTSLNINDKGHFPRYLECLKKLVSIQKKIQCFMSAQYQKRLNVLPDHYFDNPLKLDLAQFKDTSRLKIYRKVYQHGDYVDRNIYYDDATRTFGIIDWEWAGFGFPYLYDLFYLLISPLFRRDARTEKKYLDHCYMSFVETFFEESLYGYHIQEMLDDYCRDMAIDKSFVFGYLCDCLLVSYNKYRLNYNFPHYLNFQEKRLLYALENEEKFIFR